MEAKYKELLEKLVLAMNKSVRVGCTDHLDSWKEAEKIWYKPLEEAEELLKCGS